MERKGAAIAARIRGLIAGQAESLEAMARLLGVDEVALRISLDELAPYPTIEVIAAVVAKYGVDPCWLLTGEYNAEVHRAMLDSRTDELPAAITRLVESPSLPRAPAFKTPSRGLET
jgi:electron transfer flavoprotein alpha/beta subunit